MQYCTEKSWYVLRVRSQTERLVHLGLHHKQFEVLNPTYQALSIRRDRRKVLARHYFLQLHVCSQPAQFGIPFGNLENTRSGRDFEKPKLSDSFSGRPDQKCRFAEKTRGRLFLWGTDF